MDDVPLCPVCNLTLRTFGSSKWYFPDLNKEALFIERACTQGHNHSLRWFADSATGKVDIIKISLNAEYSVFVEINFVFGTSKIFCMNNGDKQRVISLPKILVPDFPNLMELKEKVSLYIIFS